MFFSVSYSFCSSRAIAFCNFQYRICWWYYGRNGETHRLPLPRLTRALVLCIVCRHMYKLRKIDRHHRSTYIFLSGEDQQLYWKRGETVRGTPTDLRKSYWKVFIVCITIAITRSRKYTTHQNTAHHRCRASKKNGTIDPKRSHSFIFMICHLFHRFLSFLWARFFRLQLFPFSVCDCKTFRRFSSFIYMASSFSSMPPCCRSRVIEDRIRWAIKMVSFEMLRHSKWFHRTLLQRD